MKTEGGMDGPHVLVVDDDRALLSALEKALQLRMAEVVVHTVDSGAAALDELDRAEYDAVVTDIKMPGIDGLSLLDEIRRRWPDIPALLITGHGQHDLAVKALRGGAFDFIQKPIDRDYFTASLTRALHVRQLGRQVEAQKHELKERAARLEQIVQERTWELRTANQAKDRFLAVLAHELRNPLAAVRCAIDYMSLCDADDSTRGEAEGTIDTQVRHMSRLLDDLLDVSRITQDRIALRREPLDLADVLQDAVRGVRPTVEHHSHRLNLSRPDEPLPIEGDPTRLEQIIVNLISNASKYTEAGGEISLQAKRCGDQAVLHVRDTGIGIPAEVLPDIFEPFLQADPKLDQAQGGLGIGLTLVKKLVELHEGTIHAESEGPGCGSLFTVRLPLAHRHRVQPESEEPPTFCTSLRILVVEDNPDLGRLTERLLQKCGHSDVRVVPDGPSALEIVDRHQPDVMLIDIGLPGMDGYQLARQMRAGVDLHSPMLVALTGYGREEDRRRSWDAGFDEHLIKPVSQRSLQEVFARAVVRDNRG